MTLRQTPLFDEHVALGARMVDFAGWHMPLQYLGIVEEHTAVRSRVGIFDICHMTEFRVCGQEALRALNRIMANDLCRIDVVGDALYTVMCDEDGGIIDDLIVYHTGDIEYLIIANAANRETDWSWITSHMPDSVEAVDETDRTALIAVQGPHALSVISELAPRGWCVPDRFSLAECTLGSVPALVARTGYTGEDGVEVLCHVSQARQMWRTLLSFPEVIPCGLGARDTLRLEMGYLLYGSDIDRGVDPISAGLGWTVPATKTGYLGAEALERIRQHGPRTKLVGLVTNQGIPRHGYTVLRDGVEAGKVTSGSFSPTLSCGIALAYVPAALAQPGTALDIEVRHKIIDATVTRPPFVKKTSLSAVAP